jgi:predicted secreted protein
MSVHDGYLILLKLATILVSGTTSQSLTTTIDEVDLTTKDSSGNAGEYSGGTFRGTLDVEGKIDEDDTYSYKELLTAQKAAAAIAFVYAKANSARDDFLPGADSYSGSAIITNLRRTDPQNAPSVWACTLRITGEISIGSITSSAA